MQCPLSDPSVTVPIALDRAAKDVVSYVNAHHLPYPKEVAELSIVLNDQYKALPSPYQDSYGDSVQSISHQLLISKGAPLTGDQVIALLKWHYDKFTAAVTADQASRAAKTATGQQLVTAAGAAFLAFLLLVFCFIFVKIERNLRVMKTLTKVVGTAL
jgi:hypothetical protein